LLGYWETLSDVDVCGELQWCALCACVTGSVPVAALRDRR